MTPTSPEFRDLDRAASERLLATHRVGRIAYTFRDRVDIEPISFVFDDGWIYGRTAPGAKLLTLQHSPWVAFEVDEARGPFEWQSVVVHGAFHQLAPDTGTPAEQARYRAALTALRRLMPAALTADDPVPTRTVVFGINVHEMTGREAVPGRG